MPRFTSLLFSRASPLPCRCSTAVCIFNEPRFYFAAVHLLRHASPSLVSPSLACTVPLFNNCALLHRALLHRASLPRCCCSSAVPRFAEPCFHGTVDRLLWNASLTLVFFTEPRFHGTADRLLCHASPSLAAMVPLFACCATLHRALLPWCHCSTAVCRFTKIVFNGAAAHWLCRALLSIAATVPLFV